ncbi:NADPH-dependent FMN reductase [Maritimibacter sp. DP1N21-5]|uniref:NADPH-dependent FMN reductase n=1 Tax=Maritimibacter sp. DP1N21-5 TaxID=2836867 RepID=UPI001C475D22|nr:NADPH-dependent FMN reductase [Maritimibacter sp. DP1N21-5]MBV7408022.1 NAD(P)H-dependent oxidoreductase [Maritimibacter sp. DP1N21-5]
MSQDAPLKIKIITASTRPGRIGPVVTDWIAGVARERAAFDIDVVDLAELDLPLMNEPKHPSMQDYQHEHTKRWAAIADEADGFIFVTPEYDFFPPASVVNALQYLLLEWSKKPAAVVSYGGVSGGLRSMQVLRGLMGNLNMVALSKSIPVPFVHRMVKDGVLEPNEAMIDGAKLMLDELESWGRGLREMRG